MAGKHVAAKNRGGSVKLSANGSVNSISYLAQLASQSAKGSVASYRQPA